MSQSLDQWNAFMDEVAKNRMLWTIRDEDEEGFPAPKNCDGLIAMPFWSSLARVERIISEVPSCGRFHPFEVAWEDFHDKWLPGLEKDGLLVGINWSEKRALGYEPKEILERIKNEINSRVI